MDRIEEVKKILERLRRLDDIDMTSYQAGINQEGILNGATNQICQLFEKDESEPDRLLDIDEYLAEMGWTISKDDMQYAWLKQFRNRQDAKTASIKDAELAELKAINESHRILNGELRVEMQGKAGRVFGKIEARFVKVTGGLVKPYRFINEEEWQALIKEERVKGQTRVCARCGSIRDDKMDSDICGNCADDLRMEQDARQGGQIYNCEVKEGWR